MGINPDFCLRAGINERLLSKLEAGSGSARERRAEKRLVPVGLIPSPFSLHPFVYERRPNPVAAVQPARSPRSRLCWKVSGRQGAARRRLLGPPPLAPRPPLRGLRSALGPPPPAAAGRVGEGGAGRGKAARSAMVMALRGKREAWLRAEAKGAASVQRRAVTRCLRGYFKHRRGNGGSESRRKETA